MVGESKVVLCLWQAGRLKPKAGDGSVGRMDVPTSYSEKREGNGESEAEQVHACPATNEPGKRNLMLISFTRRRELLSKP